MKKSLFLITICSLFPLLFYGQNTSFVENATPIDGVKNVAFGHEAGVSNDQTENVFVGIASGAKNNGKANTFLGSMSALNNGKGNRNVFLGANSGYNSSDASGNVFIGYNSGYSEKNSNLLYIENSSSTSPLIWGDFYKDIVNVNGFLAVGTTSPSSELDVRGTATVNREIINFDDTNGLDPLYIKDNDSPLTMKFYAYNGANAAAGYYQVDRNNKERFYLLAKDNGVTWIRLNNKNGSNIFSVQDDPGGLGNFIHMPQAESRMVIGGFGDYLFNDGHKFVIKDGSAMIEGDILTNSKVGIGVASVDIPADYKLAVAGKIISEEVKVKLQGEWPDYVFEDNYNLPSLEEVEKHIKEEGHLQNIPSAEEVKKNGIELGDINSKLLKKIEELTLYTIEQDKKILEQEKKNKALETRLEKLEMFLNSLKK